MSKMITCSKCGEFKVYYAHNLCKKCYQKQNYENNKENIKKRHNNYRELHKIELKVKNKQWYKRNRDRLLKLAREQNYKSRGGQPMTENKSCALYLGVIIAEQILSKVFKNVQRMPNNNPGYDFICNNNYKIDAKSSCISKNRFDSWLFNIKQNKNCDYFALLAFDNRNNLTPLYFWLIPNDIINNKQTIRISKSTIFKWSQYEQPINEIIKYCNTMRELNGNI